MERVFMSFAPFLVVLYWFFLLTHTHHHFRQIEIMYIKKCDSYTLTFATLSHALFLQLQEFFLVSGCVHKI